MGLSDSYKKYKQQQDEIKKRNGDKTSSSSFVVSNDNNSFANSYKKYKDEQDQINQRTQDRLAASRERSIQESLNRANEYQTRYSKAVDAFNRIYGTGSNYSPRDYVTFRGMYGDVLSDNAARSYKNDLDYLANVGAIDRSQKSKALSNINTKLLESADAFTKYYSQFKDRNDYILNSDSEDAKQLRRQNYQANKQRLNEVQNILDSQYNYSDRFGTSLNANYLRNPEYREQYDALVQEKNNLQRDILTYERSNKFVSDSYDDLKNNADYEKLSKQRNQNAGYRESETRNNMLDATLYTTDGNGNTYDVYGNLVTEERRNELLRQNQVQDKLGMYLNASDKERQQAATDEDRVSGTKSEAINEGIIKYWNELNEDEINNYYYLYNKEGKESAEKYLDSLEVTLGRRNNEKEQAKIANAQGLEHVWLAAKSVIGNVFGGAIAGTENIVRAIEGKDVNPYSVFQSGVNYSSNVRSYQADAINQATGNQSFLGISLGDVYQSVMSAIDSAVGGGLLGAGGYGASMGLGAMSSTARDLYENGATTDEIFFGSLLSGIAENVFETLSVERLLAIKDTKSTKTWIMNLLKQAGTEASEEVLTEIANKLTDMAVRGTSSDTLQAYYNYKKQGMTDGEATLAAFKDAGIDIYKAGVGGFISGGIGAGVRGGSQLLGYQNQIYNQGRADFMSGNYQNILAQGQQLGIEDRLNAAQARLDAYNQEQTRGNARKASRAIGRLSQSIDTQRRSQNIFDIQKALKDNGVKGNLYSKAEAINDAIDRGTLGEEYAKIINADPKVRQVYEAFMTGNRNEVLNRNREYFNSSKGIVTDAEGNIDTQATIDRRLENIGSTITDRARLQQKSFDVKINGNDEQAAFDHVADDTVYLKTATGDVVPASNVDTDANTQILLDNAPTFGIQGAKAYINGYDGKISATDYTSAFMTTSLKARLLPQDSVINDGINAGLSESAALAAFYVGRNLQQYIDNTDVEGILNYANTLTAKEIQENISDAAKGNIIKEDNITYNTDKSRLSDKVVKQIQAIGITLKAVNRDVVIEDSIDYVDNKDRVYYNAANAYFNKRDNTYHISKNAMDGAFFNIAIHETVHDIAANNSDAFKKLAQIVNKYIDSDLYERETHEMLIRNMADMADDEEMIANITSSILNHPDTFQAFADRFLTDEQSKSAFIQLIDSVLDYIKAAIEKIKDKLGWQQIKVLENNLQALEDIRNAYFEGLEGVRDNSEGQVSDRKFSRLPDSFVKDNNIDIARNKYIAVTMDPVANLTGEEFKQDETKSKLSEKVIKYYNSIGNSVDNNYLGSILLNLPGIETDIAHGVGRRKAAAFMAVPEVIEKGQIIDVQYNWKDRGYDTVVISAPIIIGTDRYQMAAVVMKAPTTDRLYVHEVLLVSGENKSATVERISRSGAVADSAAEKSTAKKEKSPSIFKLLKDLVNVNNNSSSNVKKNSVNLDTLGNQLTEEQDNYFADSKIRDNNGNLKVMYHGTNADFNIFDQLNFGEVGDTAEGFGIYLTDTREVADSYGGRIIEAYANVTRPASKNAKTIKRAELARLIKATCENEAKSLMEDGYDSVEDALKDTWVSNYTYTYDKPMNAVYNQVAADILRMNDNDMDIVQEVMSGMAIRDYAKAYEFYPLLTETMGIDGFETTWEDSTNPENPAHIVVAFNSEQVKNIDNKTPTSNPDIRYSPNQDAIDDSFVPVKDRKFTYDEFANKEDIYTPYIKESYEDASRAVIRKITLDNAKAIGRSTEKGAAIIQVFDTKKDVIVAPRSLDHGLTRKGSGRYKLFGTVAAQYGAVLQNSFLINVLEENSHFDYKVMDSDIYIGVARDEDNIYIIRSIVNNKTNELEDYSVVYAIDTKKEPAAPEAPAVQKNLLHPTDSKIKVSDVLELVNKYFPDILPEDVYKHFGHEARPEGLLGESVRYSVGLSSLDNSGEQNVENMKNTLGTQYKLNIAKKLTPEVADKIAGRILKDVHSSFDRAELATGLTQIINEAARQGKDLDVDTFLDNGTALIRDVLEKSAEFNQEAYDEDQKVRDYLTNTKIKLTGTQQQEVSHMFDSVRAYRASLFGSPVKISSSTGQSLDVVWNELSALNPVLFPADASEGDMPVYLADAAQLLKKSNYYFNPYGFDADGMAAIMFADTIADYTENKRIKTVVNQMKSYGKHYFEDTMKELNRRTRERAASQKAHTEKLKNDLTLLRAETSKWKQTYDELIINDDLDIRQAENELRQLPAGTDRFDYEQAIKGLKAEKQRHEYALREYMKMQTEKAQELQKEIEESAKEYIKAGGKGINYAMDARQAVIRTRSLAQQKQLKEQAQRRAVINTVRKNASNLLGRLLTSSDTKHVPENLRTPVANFLQNLDLGFTGEETNAAITWIENLGRLSDKMKNFNQASGTFQVDDMIIEQLDQIATDLRTRLNISGKNLNDMTLYELQQLRDTVSLINAAIYNSDRLLADDRKQRASALAERSMTEMAGKKQRKFTKGIMKLAGDFFAIDQLDSFSFAERMGKDFNDTIFKNLRKGFDKKVEYVKQGNDAFARALSKLSADQKTAKRLLQSMSGNKAEATRFDLESGRSITLTPAQVMELYLLNNREDARRHIYNGGLTVMEYGNGKNNVKKQEMIQVTESDIKAITDSLTTQQKSFAESLQQFAAHSVSEWGNNVSMTLWGIKKFTDPNYWRINVDSNTLNAVAADKKTGEVGMYHLKNIGVSKQTNEFATNPLIIGDIVDSFVQHVDEMSSYGAYTVPLDDAMKWYNYKNGNRTVQRSIENYMGVAGKQYFVDFIKALNSAQDRAGGMPILDRLISNAKVAAIAANLRVVVQQPSAYARAMDVIDPKYLVQTGNPLAGAKEAQEHSSIAAWKNWGFRDADIGQSLREVMVGDGGTIAQRINEVTGKAAGRADDVTWGAIWNAVRAEVKDKNPGLRVGSAEYWNAVSERFTEVIDKTQVVDSPFHRSKGMRSKNMLWKMATAFMSEPTKSYNMFYRTVSDAYQNGVNARTAKRFTRALVSFVTATALNSMLASIIDVIRHRDDDEDKDFWERYFNEVGQNIIDGLNPLNLIPIGKDIMSMIQGYDPSRLDLDALNRLIQTGKQAISAITGDSKDLKWERIFYDLVGEVSKITGIPAGNFLRTVDSVTNLISKAFGKDIELFGKYKEWSTSKKTAGNMYTEYKKTGKWTEDLLEKYVSMKTDEVIKEEEQRESEGHNRKYATTEDVTRYATNQVYGNFASMLAENDERIAEAYNAKVSGDGSTVSRIKNVFTDAGVPGEVFDKAVLAYGNSLDESDPKNIREFNAKLYSSDDLANAIVNGYDTDDIYNELVSDSTAKDPEKTTQDNTLKRLQEYYQQYMLEGNTRKAEEIIDRASDTFDIDESKFDKWSKSVDYMQFVDDNPNVTMTQDDYQRYQKVSASGITPEIWMEYYNQAITMKADVDKNGDAISGTRKVKVLALIDSLPITNAQKDALYYYNNWAESTIKEAPWH